MAGPSERSLPRSITDLLSSGDIDEGLRRIVQLTMVVLLGAATLAGYAIDGAAGVPPVLLVLDLIAIAGVAVPWHRWHPDAFAAIGLVAVAAVGFLAPVGDPLRSRLIPFAVLVGSGAVSPRAGLVVGVAGAAVMLRGIGVEEPMTVVGSMFAALFVSIVVPALVTTARRHRSAPRAIAPSALSDYIAVLAHEVSTPIVSVGAAAQVLATELKGRAAERTALAIAEEARQVYSLLESLSDLSALETGRLRMSLRSVDLADLVRGGFALSTPDSHRLVIDVPDEHVVVLADDRRIRQVLVNLVANATKYSAPGTAIEVRVGRTQDGGSAIVQVRDHGPGIPPAERPRLFDKFVRLSTAAGTRGSGLGLYVCRAIVQQHGGELWGEWPAGGGSVFSFTLPLARMLAGSAAALGASR